MEVHSKVKDILVKCVPWKHFFSAAKQALWISVLLFFDSSIFSYLDLLQLSRFLLPSAWSWCQTLLKNKGKFYKRTAVEQSSSCQAQSGWLDPTVFHIFAMETPPLDPPLRRIFTVVALVVVFLAVAPAGTLMWGSLVCLVLYDCRGMWAVLVRPCLVGACWVEGTQQAEQEDGGLTETRLPFWVEKSLLKSRGVRWLERKGQWEKCVRDVDVQEGCEGEG